MHLNQEFMQQPVVDQHACIVVSVVLGIFAEEDLVVKAQGKGVLINVVNGDVTRFTLPFVITREE